MGEKSETKIGPLRLLMNFVTTGRGFEDKRRFYMFLGGITLGLAALFALAVLVRVAVAVIGRL